MNATQLMHLYERFDKFIHSIAKKGWIKGFLAGQLRDAKRVYRDWKPLTKAQKREIAAFWGLRFPSKLDFITHEIMMNVKGEFDVRYCPETVFRLNFDDDAKYRLLTDKNYYERYQPGLPLPYTYVRNVNGCFLDHDYNIITREEAREIIVQHLPLIVKPSLDSGEGKNIRLITNEAETDAVFSQYTKDFLLQELIEQCDVMKKISPNSVASFRMITAMINGEAKLLKSHLLCNTTDSIAVNKNKGPEDGVVFLLTDEQGRLAETGYFENAQVLKVLPSGLSFAGLQIPSYKEAVNMALKAHQSMPMLEFVGWDITIDAKGKPMFIEWNLRGLEIYHSQLTQGPLFGEYTDYYAEKLRPKK